MCVCVCVCVWRKRGIEKVVYVGREIGRNTYTQRQQYMVTVNFSPT